MIVKERFIPTKIIKNETLLRRLLENHPKWIHIDKDLAKRKAGYNGEKATDYYVKKLPNQEFFNLFDLRLQINHDFFQIDTLILSTTFALILEIKNISGSLYFDHTFKQLIRTLNDIENGFICPIVQAERHVSKLNKWFLSRKISLPIEYLVVISNPSTIIKTDPHNIKAIDKVIHAHELVEKVEMIRKKHFEEKFSMKEVKKLAKQIVKNHTPLPYNPLKYYQIPKTSILSGVQCPSCKTIPMVRVRGSWYCTKCKTYNKDAHIQSLNDYFLLISSTVTNQQFREFLHLPSPSIAKKMLTSMNLSYTGEKKSRIYQAPPGFYEK